MELEPGDEIVPTLVEELRFLRKELLQETKVQELAYLILIV